MVSNCGTKAIHPFAEAAKGETQANRVSTDERDGRESVREKRTHPDVAVDDEADAE
jgi:hypothetical protein